MRQLQELNDYLFSWGIQDDGEDEIIDGNDVNKMFSADEIYDSDDEGHLGFENNRGGIDQASPQKKAKKKKNKKKKNNKKGNTEDKNLIDQSKAENNTDKDNLISSIPTKFHCKLDEEICLFQQRLEMEAANAVFPKIKPNINEDWIKKLRQEILKKN